MGFGGLAEPERLNKADIPAPTTNTYPIATLTSPDRKYG